MTGRDLIIHILKNHLEDHEIFEDGIFMDFLATDSEVAERFHVGVETVKAWVSLGRLYGITINNQLYISQSSIRSFSMNGGNNG